MDMIPMQRVLSNRYFWCSLVAPFLLCTLLFGALASSLPPIGGSSEAREAHIIRLMYEQDDYVLPSRNGLIPSKPPLYHWVGVFLSKYILGFSPFAARVPSLLAAAAILLVTLCLARLISYRFDQEQRALYIVVSGFVLSSSYGFERMRTVAMVDMVFAAMVTLAIGALVRRLWDQRLEQLPPRLIIRQIDKIAFFSCCALAVLAKGPIGFLLSAMIVSPLMLGRVGLREAVKFFMQPNLGWMIFILIITPWYYQAALRSQDAFIGKQIIFENLRRFVGGEHVNSQAWWFYLPALLRGAFPWSLIFIYTLPRTLRELKRIGQQLASPERSIKLLTHSVFLCLIFFSFSEGKRDSYLLPLLPWVALIVAGIICEYRGLTQSVITKKLLSKTSSLLSLLVSSVILSALMLEWYAQFSFRFQSEMLNIVVSWLVRDRAIICLMISAAVLMMIWRARSERLQHEVVYANGMIVVILMSLFVAEGYAIRNRFKDFDQVSRALSSKVGTEPLQVVREQRDEFFDAILYYLGRSVDLVTPTDFPSACRGYALVRYDQWQELRGQGVLAQAREIENYYEIDDRLRGKTSNQKVLIKCL